MKVLNPALRLNIPRITLYAATSALGFVIALFFASSAREAAVIGLSAALFIYAAFAPRPGKSGFLLKVALAADEFAAVSPVNFAMFYLPCAIHGWFKGADLPTMLND